MTYSEEGKQLSKELNLQWAALNDKLGTYTRNFVAPYLKEIAANYFNVHKFQSSAAHCWATHPENREEICEFDYIAIIEDKVFLLDGSYEFQDWHLDHLPTFSSKGVGKK